VCVYTIYLIRESDPRDYDVFEINFIKGRRRR